jgi:pyrroloquinoline quinone biosynthesis protein D
MTALPSMPRLNRLFRLQWEEAQQAWVLLYPEGMVKLNQSAAEILKKCDGTRTLDAIVAELEQAFAVTGIRSQVEGMLQLAFDKDWVQ